MLIVLILLTTLTTASAKLDAILRTPVRSKAWLDETKFWGTATCQAGRRRTIGLHETSKIGPTDELMSFFETLVTNLQTKCGSTTTIEYHVVGNETDDPEIAISSYEKQFPSNNPKFVGESKIVKKIWSNDNSTLFQWKDVDVIITRIENSVQTVMNGRVFDNFHDNRHVIVFLIIEEKDREKSIESFTNIIAKLLSRLWLEKRILNVSLVVPFTRLGYRLWLYDPFYKNPNSEIWGRIFAIDPAEFTIDDRANNLNGHTLNIGMFETTSTAIKLDSKSNGASFPFARKSRGYGGLDGSMMALIADFMNFEVTIVPPHDGIAYGYVDRNGTFVGTIGDAAYHRIDISFNSMYTKIYAPNGTKTCMFEFTVPIDFDRLCVVVPRASKIPRWLRTFYCFDPAIWACLLITQLIVSLVWYLLRKFQDSSNEKIASTTNYHVLLLDAFLLFVGSPMKLNVTQLERIILTAVLLLGLTIMGMFTGTLYHSFTTDMRYREMRTLRDVDESGIVIGTSSPNLHDVFGQSETNDDNEEVKNLRRRYKIFDYNGESTVSKTAYQRNVACLSRENLFYVLKYRYVDEDGNGLLHLVDECPRSYYLAYIVPKDSVYINRLNVVIRRVQNAGLSQLWSSVVTNKLAHEAMAKANKKRVKPLRASFTMKDVQTSFFILSFGHLVATIVFVAEFIFRGKRRAKKIERGKRVRVFLN